MAEQSSPQKWRGNSTVAIPGATPEQVWPFLADFGNVHKWLPTIDTCHLVEGIPCQPGLTRYCASTETHPTGTNTKWAKERLLAIDPADRSLSYEVTENNVGFRSYVATLRVVPFEGGCKIEWGFTCEPVEGWKEEDLKSYVDFCLQHMGKTMGDEVARVV